MSVVCVACGLERDYEAFLKAAKGPTEGSESSGDGVPGSSDAGASTGTTSHGETGAAGAMTGSGGTTDTAGASGGGTSTGGTSTGGTSTGGASTGDGEAPYCGDGVVNQSFEECDDGNLDETDRCAVTCHKIRLLFVTSTLLQGKMSGLAGADAYCKSLALAARQEDPDSPIEDPGNFKALLSSSTQSIWDRHYDGKGPYKLVNGLRVSESFAALFNAPLENPIDVDERSQVRIGPVWTGTDVDGSPYPGIDFCADWTSLKGSANVGDNTALDSQWVHSIEPFNPGTDCLSECPIYCVEQM